MAIQDSIKKFHLPKFWDDEFKSLKYINEPFNDKATVAKWLSQGYSARFTGDMCDMHSAQPSWNKQFVLLFEVMGWKNIGTSYYKMKTGTIMPPHRDTYSKYVELFNLQGKETSIQRAIVFLEDWKPGHYSELDGKPYVNWLAGDTVWWNYDTPHAAANIGIDDRYTLQITGHK